MYTGLFLGSYVGRVDLAGPILDRLLDLDPLSGINWLFASFISQMEGKLETSLERLQRGQELNPDFLHIRFWIGQQLAGGGRIEEALNALKVNSGREPNGSLREEPVTEGPNCLKGLTPT